MKRLALVVAAILVVLTLAGFNGHAQTPASKVITIDQGSLSPRSSPLILGVGVHFGIGGEYNYVEDKSAAALSELGAESYRDDLPWSAFDRPNQAPGTQPKKLFDFMKATPARPLLILGSPNAAVPDGNPPLGHAGQTAFANFVGRAAAATLAKDPIYEIWNEWNMNAVRGRPWLVGPGDVTDPRAATHYADLAKTAFNSLHAAAPNSPILLGAVGIDKDWQWTKAIVKDGVFEGPSALSVHMYNHCDPDTQKRTATEMVDRLDDLQSMLSDKGHNPTAPIYVTEVGWPTALKPCAISRQTAANNIAQFMLWSASATWMKGVWIYQLKDQGTDPNDMEANFGLYDYNYRPKPAACAFRNAARIIKSSTSFKLQRPFPDTFVLQVSSNDGLRLVAWTTSDDRKATISLANDAGVTAAALCSTDAKWNNHGVTVGAEPVAINIPGVQSENVMVVPAY